ncbi:uncharacterized protein [Narcine bancroftii]|uniref:uncharacterized protein isoform X4 n=1 Tax=Narcine bancroftii TaxID=1343680 RepID=UPI003831B253
MGDRHLRQGPANREIKNKGSANVFYCKICDVHCTSKINLKMHFIGIKHRKNEKTLKNVPGPKGHMKIMETNASKSVKRNVPRIDARHAYGSSVLEQHFRDMDIQDPIIGLNHVIECRTETSPDPMFFCELCNCQGGFTTFIPHLLGFKHRLRYMNTAYPGVLQFDREKLKQSEVNAIVKEKAGLIEKNDGRGKIKVILNDIPSEFFGGNTATKRAPATYGPTDSRLSHHENLRNNFGQNMNAASLNSHELRMAQPQDPQFDPKFSPRENYKNSFRGDMKNSFETRMLYPQDEQLGNRFSRYENFGNNFDQHLNRESSSCYESRMPCSQDYQSSGDILQDRRKNIKSEVLDMDWNSDNIQDFGDGCRRRELMRSYQNENKGSDVDDGWMQNELDASKTTYSNQEVFEYLQNFQISSDSDASFALKVTQSLTDVLMEYRLKMMTEIKQEKRPRIDEEIRRASDMPGERLGYEMRAPANESYQRCNEYPSNIRTQYTGCGTWKKPVAMHSKANNRKIGFQSNRKQFKPTTFNVGVKKRSSILNPHLLKTVKGLDIVTAKRMTAFKQ